jgi:hypothetical protein
MQSNTVTPPLLNDGEIYVGAIISADGSKNHNIILLPGESDDVNWKYAMEWAVSIGGELPDHCESALLFSTMKHEFKPEWYWLREQYTAYSSYAWCQNFHSGGQDYYCKTFELRARAVRRLEIL